MSDKIRYNESLEKILASGGLRNSHSLAIFRDSIESESSQNPIDINMSINSDR